MINNFHKEDWVSEAIIDNMGDPVAIVDIDEIIVYVNKCLLRLCEYDKKDLIGKKTTALHSKKDIREWLQTIVLTRIKHKILNLLKAINGMQMAQKNAKKQN